MTLKSFIVPRLAERLLGEKKLIAERHKFERQRIKAGDDHIVEFFHDPSDPYSQILQKVLPIFERNFRVAVVTRLVSPPDDSAAPERDKLRAYSKLDALRLAKKAGLEFEVKDAPPALDTSVADARRAALGHYLGATLYYGGEWYWGLDRLHYLEARLTDLGLRQNSKSEYIFSPPDVPLNSGESGAEIHWYLSFRSPYSAIVRDRVKALADAYGAQLRLRFVQPMVMRGLPVPSAKAKYIPLDAAREARRLGVPFGRILDPVGRPVELGYSLLSWARENGKDYEYAQSWLRGVWAEGIDAGSTKGLRQIVERAGLDWAAADKRVGRDDWRVEAETNQTEMLDLGKWGVPSFRVNDIISWGQDRLWVIEDTLNILSRNNA